LVATLLFLEERMIQQLLNSGSLVDVILNGSGNEVPQIQIHDVVKQLLFPAAVYYFAQGFEHLRS
jgi:hypothetical protein